MQGLPIAACDLLFFVFFQKYYTCISTGLYIGESNIGGGGGAKYLPEHKSLFNPGKKIKNNDTYMYE